MNFDEFATLLSPLLDHPAAQAALAYRRHDKRGSALGCATRAAALAEQCGASTSTLRQASEPLPLTDREEVAELAQR